MLDFARHVNLYSEDHIAYLDEHIQDNAWLTYFVGDPFLGYNWIDFETEIQRALNQVELFYCDTLPSSKNTIPSIYMPASMKKVISIFSIKANKTENSNVVQIKIFYHSQTGYENQVINLIDMFGKDYVIDQTGRERIVFEKLKLAVTGSPKKRTTD